MEFQMLTEKQLERYADVLIWGLRTSRTARLKKNDIFMVRYSHPAIGLAEILQARLLDMGMHPILRMVGTPCMERNFFEKANPKQLVFQAPGEKKMYQHLNGSIYLHAPESITHLGHIDPKKIGRAAVARKYIRDILDKREEKGLFSWTLCMLPTMELARHAGLTTERYAQQIVMACFLNKTKPLDAWQEIYKNATGIKKWLNGMAIKSLHIESKNIDLRVRIGDQRQWVGVSGHNIPSFEIFVSPDWRGTSGVYHADQPSFRSGNLVEGARISFEKGTAVTIKAHKGEAFVKKQLAMDPGAKRLGEFSLTDKRF